jgi:hypothetical protein
MDLGLSLETWLITRAELSGAKLTAAVNACKAGMIDSVNDLLELSKTSEQFKEAFSQAMIRSKVLSALERDKDNIKAQNEKEPPKVFSSSAIPPTKHQMQKSSATKHSEAALQLPPGKLYHFFASHKVRSVFELCFGSIVCDSLLICCVQKMHSVHGSISEAIARAAKDWLELARGLCGFFDVSADLTTRTPASLTCMAS